MKKYSNLVYHPHNFFIVISYKYHRWGVYFFIFVFLVTPSELEMIQDPALSGQSISHILQKVFLLRMKGNVPICTKEINIKIFHNFTEHLLFLKSP